MPIEGQNTGSFGAAIPGGVDAIKEALQRRGLGGNVPIAGQVSGQEGGVPGGPAGLPQPIPQAPTAPIGQGAAPTAPTASEATTAPQEQGLPVGNPEAEIILKALGQRLASISKQEEARGTQAPTFGPGGLI